MNQLFHASEPNRACLIWFCNGYQGKEHAENQSLALTKMYNSEQN